MNIFNGIYNSFKIKDEQYDEDIPYADIILSLIQIVQSYRTINSIVSRLVAENCSLKKRDERRIKKLETFIHKEEKKFKKWMKIIFSKRINKEVPVPKQDHLKHKRRLYRTFTLDSLVRNCANHKIIHDFFKGETMPKKIDQQYTKSGNLFQQAMKECRLMVDMLKYGILFSDGLTSVGKEVSIQDFSKGDDSLIAFSSDKGCQQTSEIGSKFFHGSELKNKQRIHKIQPRSQISEEMGIIEENSYDFTFFESEILLRKFFRCKILEIEKVMKELSEKLIFEFQTHLSVRNPALL